MPIEIVMRLFQRTGMPLALILAGLAGCRSNGAVDQLVQRELRLQEETIWDLEDELRDREMELAALEHENQTLKKDRSGDHGAEDGADQTLRQRAKENNRPLLKGLRKNAPKKEHAPPPEINFGEETLTPGDSNAPALGDPDSARQHRPGRLRLTSAEGVEEAGYAEAEEPEDLQVAALAFNKRLTGRLPHDAFRGHGGIMVAFTAKNAAGEVLPPVGDISIAVMDPALSGKAQRVARWDFTSRQAVRYYKKGVLGSGYQFELPWGAQFPRHEDLHLFVRMRTARGDDLTIDTPLNTLGHRPQSPAALPEERDDDVAAKSEPEPPVAEEPSAEPDVPAPLPERTARATRPAWNPTR